jgi:hypothetical protein
MNPSELERRLPPVPAQQRFAVQARLLKLISGMSQIALMVALFVMWKQFNIPFAKAFERCFVAGVLVYVTLGTIASVMLSLARVQPIQMLLRRVMGIVSVLIFGALHYVYHLGIVQSAGAWAAIYAGSRILLARIESRAVQRFQLRS